MGDLVVKDFSHGQGSDDTMFPFEEVADLRDRTKDQVDIFLNAYLSVNPKK
jgi:hypothetical protein